jgi:hypothetical protein
MCAAHKLFPAHVPALGNKAANVQSVGKINTLHNLASKSVVQPCEK